MLRTAAVGFVLSCLIVLSGCGKAKPKYSIAPPDPPTTTTTADGDKPDETSTAGDSAGADGQTAEGSATGDAATPAEPEVPSGPRPSLLVKVMTDPLQDALQSNMAALQAVIGTVTKQAGVGAAPAAEPAKPTDETKPVGEGKPAEEAKPAEAATTPN